MPPKTPGTLSKTMKVPDGYTLCSVCHRSMETKDVDDQGRCPDCSTPAPGAAN